MCSYRHAKISCLRRNKLINARALNPLRQRERTGQGKSLGVFCFQPRVPCKEPATLPSDTWCKPSGFSTEHLRGPCRLQEAKDSTGTSVTFGPVVPGHFVRRNPSAEPGVRCKGGGWAAQRGREEGPPPSPLSPDLGLEAPQAEKSRGDLDTPDRGSCAFLSQPQTWSLGHSLVRF